MKTEPLKEPIEWMDIMLQQGYLELNPEGSSKYIALRYPTHTKDQLEFIVRNNLSMLSLQEVIEARLEHGDTNPDWLDYPFLSNDAIMSYTNRYGREKELRLCRNFSPLDLQTMMNYERGFTINLEWNRYGKFPTWKDVFDYFGGEPLTKEDFEPCEPGMLADLHPLWQRLVKPNTLRDYINYSRRPRATFRGYQRSLVCDDEVPWIEGVSFNVPSFDDYREGYSQNGAVVFSLLSIDPFPSGLWRYNGVDDFSKIPIVSTQRKTKKFK